MLTILRLWSITTDFSLLQFISTVLSSGILHGLMESRVCHRSPSSLDIN
jgi:hypothetical protein